MRLVRIAIANVNTTVGAMRSNVDRVIALAKIAAGDDASIALFPEQAIGGYSPEDLVQWRAFVEAQASELERLASETSGLRMPLAIGVTVARGAHLYNSAALLFAGKIWGIVPKEKLPLYNVFYEARTFGRGASALFDEISLGLKSKLGKIPFGDLIFEFDFGTVALEVCEDIWSPDGPMRRRSYAGAELVLNLSASPFRLGVVATRREILTTRSADNVVTVAYANLVGANDGLIFDGGGYVAQNGRLVLDAPRFREGVTAVTVDLDRTRRLRTENTTWRQDQEAFAQHVSGVRRISILENTRDRKKLIYPIPKNRSFFLPSEEPTLSPRETFCEDLMDALALGIGDYFEKTAAFKTIGVALSGGRDSLFCLILARRYIDQKYSHLSAGERHEKAQSILRGFYLPTRYSSAETRAAAERAAEECGAVFASVSIDDAFERELSATESMLQKGEPITALTRQNVQARIRAERMWNWANSAQGLFLQTSNMSEKAVGYTTIGGDMEGALSVIANVPKTVVNYLLDYLLEQTRSEAIRLTLLKPASAELADDMEDERDLMPFPVLDACFALYAGEKMAMAEVSAVLCEMFPNDDRGTLEGWAAKFVRLFSQSIYKWVQTPISLHVGNLDLERERALQLPVVQKSQW